MGYYKKEGYDIMNQDQKEKNNVYSFICRFFSEKKIMVATAALFILIMLPIMYAAFFSRATGDDYGYGVWTRAAWQESHSLINVFGAACETVRNVYNSWQGTWTSVFLFTLQPEVFSEHAYVITAFLAIFLLLLGIGSLLYEIYYRRLGFTKKSWITGSLLFFLVSILFVPSTKSAIYWYNGMVHYTIPYVLCLILTTLVLQYERKAGKASFAAVFFIMTLLGGVNYQAALFALIIVFFAVLWGCAKKKEIRMLWLVFPMVSEAIGLLVSMKAPGNQVRGGENFGFSAALGLKTVGESFRQGVLEIRTYIIEKPIVLLFFLLLFLIVTLSWCGRQKNLPLKNGGWIVMAMFCLYCAMQAPAIYAGVDVSGGVYNMNYWTCLLFLLSLVTLAACFTGNCIQKKNVGKAQEIVQKYLLIPGLLLVVIGCVFFRSSIKESTWYVCIDYLKSGQAADYKEQMDLQTSIMTDDKTEDIIVPFINDEQGPLMHMPVTADPEAWSNTVAAQYYQKRSVKAIPREEWLELYENK